MDYRVGKISYCECEGDCTCGCSRPCGHSCNEECVCDIIIERQEECEEGCVGCSEEKVLVIDPTFTNCCNEDPEAVTACTLEALAPTVVINGNVRTVTLNYSGSVGAVQFSKDKISWQDSPVFSNLTIGRLFYIKDEVCEVFVSLIFGTPNYPPAAPSAPPTAPSAPSAPPTAPSAPPTAPSAPPTAPSAPPSTPPTAPQCVGVRFLNTVDAVANISYICNGVHITDIQPLGCIVVNSLHGEWNIPPTVIPLVGGSCEQAPSNCETCDGGIVTLNSVIGIVGSQVTANVTGLTGTQPFTYEITVLDSNGAPVATSGSGPTFNFTPLIPGSHSISIKVFNCGNPVPCETLVTAIAVAEGPSGCIPVTSHGVGFTQHSTGVGNPISLISGPNGTAPFTYEWTVIRPSGPNLTFATQNITFTPSVAGDYHISLVVTNCDGDTVAYNVTENVSDTPSGGGPLYYIVQKCPEGPSYKTITVLPILGVQVTALNGHAYVALGHTNDTGQDDIGPVTVTGYSYCPPVAPSAPTAPSASPSAPSAPSEYLLQRCDTDVQHKTSSGPFAFGQRVEGGGFTYVSLGIIATGAEPDAGAVTIVVGETLCPPESPSAPTAPSAPGSPSAPGCEEPTSFDISGDQYPPEGSTRVYNIQNIIGGNNATWVYVWSLSGISGSLNSDSTTYKSITWDNISGGNKSGYIVLSVYCSDDMDGTPTQYYYPVEIQDINVPSAPTAPSSPSSPSGPPSMPPTAPSAPPSPPPSAPSPPPTEGCAELAPTGLVANTSAANLVQLNWVDNSGAETGYEVQYSTDGSSWSTYAMLSANTTSLNSIPGGATINHNTVYYFRVRATGTCNANFSNTASILTAPSPVLSLQANQTGSIVELSLTWTNASPNQGSYPLTYKVEGSSLNFCVTSGGFRNVSFTPLTNLLVNNLIGSNSVLTTSYSFRVTAININGVSSVSDVVIAAQPLNGSGTFTPNACLGSDPNLFAINPCPDCTYWTN